MTVGEATPALAWRRLADLPVGVFDHAAGVSGRSVVITGGIEQSGVTSDVAQMLDLDAESWSQPLKLSRGRAFHAQVTLADGRVLIAGGQSGQLPAKLTPLASAELLTPPSPPNPNANDAARDATADHEPPSWKVTALPDLPEPVAQPTAHLLPDGRAIFIGGSRASIFDPVGNKWTQHISLRQKRQAHASVVLPDGRVLVAGGLDRDSFEVVDVSAGRSMLLSPHLPGPRDDLRVALTEDGRVWVLGGQNSKTGDTVEETWLLTVDGDRTDKRAMADGAGNAKSRLVAGPPLLIHGGQADAALGQLGRWVVLVGGESQQGGHDTEWDVARLLDRRKLKVFGLPALSQPHDDAVAVGEGHRVIVLGGYLLSPAFQGAPPTPVASSRVESLTLPEAAFAE